MAAEAQQLLDRVSQEMPKLTEDLVPGVVTLTTLHKVLQNLLAEKVPIRDMRTILETLAEHAPLQSDPHELTAVVRVALGRAITQQWFPGNEEVQVIGPIPRWSVCCFRHCRAAVDLSLADRLLAQTQEALSRQKCLARRRYYWLTMRYVHYCPAFAAQFTAAGGVVEP